jgi:hypothetical protein
MCHVHLGDSVLPTATKEMITIVVMVSIYFIALEVANPSFYSIGGFLQSTERVTAHTCSTYVSMYKLSSKPSSKPSSKLPLWKIEPVRNHMLRPNL